MSSEMDQETATSACGVTTEQDLGDSGSSLESLMKLKSDADRQWVVFLHAKARAETTEEVWIQAAKTAEEAKVKKDVALAERVEAWKELYDINTKLEAAQVTHNKKTKSAEVDSAEGACAEGTCMK